MPLKNSAWGLIFSIFIANLLILQIANSESFRLWITDLQDQKIEEVLRLKVEPLLQEIQVQELLNLDQLIVRYQDAWRIPVDVFSLDHHEIENWHKRYLLKGNLPVVLIDSFQDSVLIRIDPERVIIAGPFVESEFWKKFDLYFVFFFSSLIHLSLIWLYVIRRSRRVSRIENFLDHIIQGERAYSILDGRNDELTALSLQCNEVGERLRKWQLEKEHTLNVQRDLLHGVAHELRAPMARMQFAIELIQSNPNRNDAESLWGQIKDAQIELDSLVREVLGYAQLRAGALQLQISDVMLVDLFNLVKGKLEPIYANVKFIVRKANDSSERISGDERQLQRALINLMRNAARYALRQVLVQWHSDSTHIVITVEDDGPGIPVEKWDVVFDPFTRLDDSRNKDSGGAGLGLAVARSICERHGGALNIIHGDLGGACFQIRLPLTLLVQK